MIDRETLKKHNLKAVPFSCIREGETFHLSTGFSKSGPYLDFERRLEGELVNFASGSPMYNQEYACNKRGRTAYVPVWRHCGEVVK